MKNNELRHRLGKNIARLRKESGMSQDEFAVVSGKMINTISNIERGISDPKISTLEAIAGALNVSLTDLLVDNLPHNLSTDENKLLEEIIRILKNEDVKTLKAVISQIQTLLNFKKNT